MTVRTTELDKIPTIGNWVLIGIHAVLTTVAGALIFIMMSIVVVDVAGRYLFNRPLPMTYELSELLMVSIIFFAIGAVERKGEHIRVTVITERLSEKLQTWLLFLSLSGCIVFYGLVVWQTALFASTSWQIRESTMGLVSFPVWVWKAFIPMGSFLLFLEFARGILTQLRRASGGSHK